MTAAVEAPPALPWPEGALYHSPVGLYDFQAEGVAMARLRSDLEDGRGGAMAVWDTGLGKSHLGMVLHALLVEDDLADLCVVIAEKNKISEWTEDFGEFTRLKALRHHGSGRMQRLAKHGVPDVLVTTYETAKADLVRMVKEPGKRGTTMYPGPLLEILESRRVLFIFDEVTKIKNRGAGTHKAFDYAINKVLRKRTGSACRAVGLTATPLETGLEDYFNILRIIRPRGLPLVKDFNARYVKARDLYDRPVYHRDRIPEFYENYIRPVQHRKRKTDEDVRDQFPALTEESLHVEMPPELLRFYDMVRDLQDEADEDSEEIEPIPGLWTTLRQIAGNPQALLRSPGKLSQMLVAEVGADYLRSLPTPKVDYLTSDADLICNKQGDKLLVFTFFGQSVLPSLADALRNTGKDGIRVFLNHGQMSPDEQTEHRMGFRRYDGPCVMVSSDAGSRGLNMPEASYVCVQKDTQVLTGDLRWVPAHSLLPGDGIVGCEEDAREGRGREKTRRWRLGEVTNNRIESRRCLTINLSNGESLTVTPEHRMIAQTRKGIRGWVQANQIKPGWKVLKYLDTWEPETSFDAGWLSGMFDGEGCYTRCGRSTTLVVAQNPGLVLDRLRSLVTAAKFSVREVDGGSSSVRRFHINGGRAEQTRFLGTYQPIRLIRRWQQLIQDHIISSIETPEVLSVEDAGVQEIAVLETSIRTFVGAGYMHHNCNYELPTTYARYVQRINRASRLVGGGPTLTVRSYIMSGTVEASMAETMMTRNEDHDMAVGDHEYDDENFISAADRREMLNIHRKAKRR